VGEVEVALFGIAEGKNLGLRGGAVPPDIEGRNREIPMNEHANVLAAELRERMDRETELFTRLCQEVERLRDCFQQKEWNAGLAIAQGIEFAARMIEEADTARDDAFALLRDALELPREIAFSALLPALPDETRPSLEEGWRRLRVSVVRLKTVTGTMRYCAEALGDTLNRILEQLFPYRKGKIYSRHGTPTGLSGAMLVDHKL
jgi:hypothetical protein